MTLSWIILAFGVMMLLAGLLVMVNPAILPDFLKQHADKPSVYVMAVLVRVLVGVLLIMLSAQSRFPLPVAVTGWVLLASALALLFIGRRKFQRLVVWVVEKTRKFVRPAGVLGVLFGVFLIVAFT